MSESKGRSMDTDRDMTPVVRSWLHEDRHEDVTRVFAAVLDQLYATPQRRSIWLARRHPIMNSLAKVGLTAAAVVVAAVIGLQVFGSSGVGGPAPSSSPSPTSAPAPSDTASQAASPSPGIPIDFAALPMGALQPGDYAFTTIPGTDVVFTVGGNWERNIPDWVVWSADDDKATMGALTIDNLYKDPCKQGFGLREPPVGPTVDDLATALREIPGVTYSKPTPVTQDGYSGVRVDYVPPSTFGDCLGGADVLLSPQASGLERPTLRAPVGRAMSTVYIYDVDGTRVVIVANYTDQRRADLDSMLESIRFE